MFINFQKQFSKVLFSPSFCLFYQYELMLYAAVLSTHVTDTA